MVQAGLKTIILLSFVLAISFLLVILSCALWSNWLPLFTALIFALAPLPNFICSRCVGDDFSAEYSSGPVDFGHFVTSMFLVSGVALPFVLAHSGVIAEMAGWMSAIGGIVGYATIITYSHFFAIQIQDY
ncbi:vacuolar protein sorting 55 protein [Leucosporidium creatinivorum]|uniref:Vacuolar protein sorting 55 protein n=1 Tax=Leucosporidium creatinivorum TaxID=106004 RepID=A0A1Y2DU90_9BASI|nr:vacuolar protein sorting 55 protein [Leucosporidium creatinivorum]